MMTVPSSMSVIPNDNTNTALVLYSVVNRPSQLVDDNVNESDNVFLSWDINQSSLSTCRREEEVEVIQCYRSQKMIIAVFVVRRALRSWVGCLCQKARQKIGRPARTETKNDVSVLFASSGVIDDVSIYLASRLAFSPRRRRPSHAVCSALQTRPANHTSTTSRSNSTT